jgi:hypothetical protein
MRSSMTAIASLMVGGVLAWSAQASAAAAQPTDAPGDHHVLPQSLVFEHEDTMRSLEALAKKPGQVGVVARKARDLFKRHTAREREFILPALTLLPDIADGKASPDMAWALAMTDKVKAEREQIFQEHEAVTTAMNELLVAGERAHDQQAVEFARAAAADSLNDLEILEPAVMLVGAYLHEKLPAGR